MEYEIALVMPYDDTIERRRAFSPEDVLEAVEHFLTSADLRNTKIEISVPLPE